MKEYAGNGSQRKSEAVEKECRTSRGQTEMTDHRCVCLCARVTIGGNNRIFHTAAGVIDWALVSLPVFFHFYLS